VIQRLCHRCHSVLHIEDAGTLVYCWNCGAPQVTLSEELLDQAAAQKSQFEAAAQSPDGSLNPTPGVEGQPQPPDLLMIWKAAIVIAAIVAAGISVLSVILPPLELLAWMAPAIALSIYSSRYKQTHITTGIGARLGLVCGVFCGFGLTIATAAQMLVLRYGLHRGDEFTASMDAVLAHSKAQVVAQSGPAAAVFFNQFSIPEFRAGFFLAGLGLVTTMLLVLSTAGGAFAGFMRSRARVR